jgi:hypothetical protein
MEDTCPQPRGGALGVWDRIVGPGMPADEARIVLLAGLAGAAVAAWRFDAKMGFGWAVALAALIGFDVIGGAVCNATQTTKRWYDRNQHARRAKLGFILPHLGYVALVAWLWRGSQAFDVGYFVTVSAALVAGAVVILTAPGRLAGPMAFGMFLAALTAITVSVGLTPGLEWFAPGLLLKLLIGHLVPPNSAV